MGPEHWYWDTCIFVAYLNDNKAAYGHHIDHIGQFLDDCRTGTCSIYTSTITIAEITSRHLAVSKFGSFFDFLDDFGGSIIQVSADPNVMRLASSIRGFRYVKSGGTREVGTPDAIHLASALALQSTFGVKLSGFHTFDNGGSRGLDGRSVPLLSYESWCEQCAHETVAQQVISLRRTRPDHSQLRRTVPTSTAVSPPLDSPEA